jgi:hypothetical protein
MIFRSTNSSPANPFPYGLRIRPSATQILRAGAQIRKGFRLGMEIRVCDEIAAEAFY